MDVREAVPELIQLLRDAEIQERLRQLLPKPPVAAAVLPWRWRRIQAKRTVVRSR
ncbi:MAG: hypothetical protein K6T31_10730 [Alicyclobacillus sp.]|nr:hypothetical protein [Alicyclobacillus sp.]